MITSPDKAAFEVARVALQRATAELLRLKAHSDLPSFVWAGARRRYELARVDYFCCASRLRIAARAPSPAPEAAALTTVIIGSDAHVRESIAVLLRVHGRVAVHHAAPGRWYADPGYAIPQVVVIDVRRDSLTAAHWIIDTLRRLSPQPYVIALTWAVHTASLANRVDRAVAKPLAIRQLLAALDGAPAVLRRRASASTRPPTSSPSLQVSADT